MGPNMSLVDNTFSDTNFQNRNEMMVMQVILFGSVCETAKWYSVLASQLNNKKNKSSYRHNYFYI